MREALKAYRSYIALIMDGHKIAETAMEKLGKALRKRHRQITEEELCEEISRILLSKEASTIKNIAIAQEYLRRRLDPESRYYEEALIELEISPEYVFQVMRANQQEKEYLCK